MGKAEKKKPIPVSIAGGIEALRTRVTDIRCVLGMKQHGLAKAVGIPRTKLSNMLWGKETVARKDVEAIASALGVTFDRLVQRPKPGTEGEVLPERLSGADRDEAPGGLTLPDWVECDVGLLREVMSAGFSLSCGKCPHCGENVLSPIPTEGRILRCGRCGFCMPESRVGKPTAAEVVGVALSLVARSLSRRGKEQKSECERCRRAWFCCGIRVTDKGEILR